MKRGKFVSSIWFIGIVFSLLFYWGCEENFIPTDPGDLDTEGLFGALSKSGEINYDVQVIIDLEYSSFPTVINDDGIIAGFMDKGEDRPAFRWKDGHIDMLGPLDAYVNSINNQGVIVGKTTEYSVMWDVMETDYSIIEFDDRIESFWVQSVNDAGAMVGKGGIPEVNGLRGIVLQGTDVVILEPLDGISESIGESINNNGIIAGHIRQYVGGFAAVIWDLSTGTSPTKLQSLGDTDSYYAIAINEQGDVVGNSYYDGTNSALLWQYNGNGQWASPITIHSQGRAEGISNRENGYVTIVGQDFSGRNSRQAVAWTVGPTGAVQMHELPLPSGYRPNQYHSGARDINSDGWITGVVITKNTGLQNNPAKAVLWKPGEEPTDPEEPGDPEGAITVAAIEYSTHGGREKNNHLSVRVSLVDDNGSPAANVSISIELHHDGNHYESRTGTTGSDGAVSFTFNNAPDGSYTTDVTDVEGDWDGITPENGFDK